MKTCCRCKQLKQFSDFYVKSRYPDGFEYACKTCMAPQEKIRRAKSRQNKLLGIVNPPRVSKIKPSSKTQNLRNKIKQLIARKKIMLYFGHITEEEFKKRLNIHQEKLRVSILDDKMRYNKKEDKIKQKQFELQKIIEEKEAQKQIKREQRRIEKERLRIERYSKKSLKKITQAIYERNKRKTNPLYQLACNLRHRTNMALKKGDFTKKSSLNQYLGCTMKEFKIYLESLFKSGMSWNNYGIGLDKWNLDHTIPLTKAKTADELHLLCHYLNVKPMWSYINSSKNSRIPEEWELYKKEHNIDESVNPYLTTPQAATAAQENTVLNNP